MLCLRLNVLRDVDIVKNISLFLKKDDTRCKKRLILNDTLNTVDQSKMESIGGSDCMVEIRHYSSYFSALGATSEEIEENSLSDCALLLDDI